MTDQSARIIYEAQRIAEKTERRRDRKQKLPLGQIIAQLQQIHDPATGGVPASALPAVALAGVSVTLHPPYLAASAAATNLAATTFSAVDDPSYRWMGDLRGRTHVRIMGRIGGSLVAATKLRVQYHVGGDPAVVTGDGGWTTLATTAGSHTLATLFYTAELSVPSGAQINNVLIRVGLYDGDGAADPTISACILSLYP